MNEVSQTKKIVAVKNDSDSLPQQKTAHKDDKKAFGYFKKLKNIKHIEIIIACLAVVVMLVIYFSSKSGLTADSGAKASDNTSVQSAGYCEKMESDLTNALKSLKGAGNVKVIINWESSVETVIAYITSNGSTSTTTTPQIISSQGGSKPIVLMEVYPKALGVIIMCQGGDNVSVKLDIIHAVSTLLNLTPDKISVYTMTK